MLVSQDDMMLLKEARDRCFSVKLLFKVLDQSIDVVFPHWFTWNSWVPIKVGFFAWEAS